MLLTISLSGMLIVFPVRKDVNTPFLVTGAWGSAPDFICVKLAPKIITNISTYVIFLIVNIILPDFESLFVIFALKLIYNIKNSKFNKKNPIQK